MLLLIFLALLNGILIATSRVINAHLGKKVGAIGTALCAHAVGFVFLSLIIATLFRSDIAVNSAVPSTAWFGGVLGVAFVALNSHAVPKLGAGRTTSFVVGAQMLASVGIDCFSRGFSAATVAAMGGAALIVAGVWLAASTSRKWIEACRKKPDFSFDFAFDFCNGAKQAILCPALSGLYRPAALVKLIRKRSRRR